MFFERPNYGDRTVLVHVTFKGEYYPAEVEEFEELADSAGAVRVAEILSKRAAPTPSYLVGKGKLEEIQHAVITHKASPVSYTHLTLPTKA